MSNIKWVAAGRAWKILSNLKIGRRRPFAVGLRLVRRLIKRLTQPLSSTPTPTRLRPHYAAERQFSFHETPILNRKLHRRARLPCINPKVVEFDCALESERRVVEEEEEGGEGRRRLGGGACDYEEEEGDGGIDLRAEKFISMFYEEMKMQNQFSYLPYHQFSYSDE